MSAWRILIRKADARLPLDGEGSRRGGHGVECLTRLALMKGLLAGG